MHSLRWHSATLEPLLTALEGSEELPPQSALHRAPRRSPRGAKPGRGVAAGSDPAPPAACGWANGPALATEGQGALVRGAQTALCSRATPSRSGAGRRVRRPSPLLAAVLPLLF